MSATRFSATLIVENAEREGFVSEHGLALWLDTPQGAILFDTGQGKALIPNAERLNIDIAQAHFLVLSHGHYDHTGALDQALGKNDSLMLVHHPEVFRTRYSLRPNEAPRDISIPAAAAAAIRALPPQRVCSSRGPVELVADVGTTGEVPRANTFEDVGGPFFLDKEGKTPDDIPDDQSIWVLTEKGLVVICGCAHSGVVNTVHQARRITGEHRVAGLIGGFHLNAASENRLRETARVLLDWNVGFVAPCHCSGSSAITYLRTVLGNRVKAPGPGDTLKF
ncbi:MAG: MBL fold metallo-hydrolase [Rhodospirillaceae bacterium]|nr:MBL fold metallo-hydrolase [Rhodospirillaceae bacterium]